jgi:hypothetical protein
VAEIPIKEEVFICECELSAIDERVAELLIRLRNFCCGQAKCTRQE